MTLLELLDHYRVDYRTFGSHHHTTTGNVNVDCQQCSPDWKSFRLGLHLEKPLASCWSCGSLNYLKCLHELTRESYQKLKELLGSLVRTHKEQKPRGKLVLPSGVVELLPVHKKYLKARGFDPEEIISLWGVKGISLHATLAWRLFIPITYKGRVVSWTTRSLTNKGVRYISASSEEEEIPHKTLLYQEELATHSIIVAEGPTDVWRIGPGAVCTFGLSYSQAQVRKIACYPLRVIVMDSEPVAQRKARELCNSLSIFPGETLQVTLTASDPGSAEEKELRKLRKLIS